MKTNLLSTLPLILFSSALFAQTFDAPRPNTDKVLETPFQEKAGNYGLYCGHALTNNAVPNNGNDGVMFKIKAKENIYINGFSTSIVANGSNSGYYRIYRKNGTYIGHETAPISWNLVDTAFVTSAGGNIIFTNVNPDAFIPAGNEVSFYITGSGAIGTDYKDGNTEGGVLVENADLILYEGKGVQFPFGANFTPRDFVGKIHYCKPSQFTCDTSATTYNDENSNYGVFFNVVTHSKAVTLDNIFGDIAGPGLSKFSVYTKTGTFEGAEGTPASWTLLDTIQLSNPINNGPSALTNGFSVIVPPNSIQGFHIVSSANMTIDYRNGVGFNDTIRNKPFISITGGKGADAAFTSNGLPRKFNGTVSYCVDNTSINENTINALGIFPNPSADFVNIPTGGLSVENIQMIDITGKTVMNLGAQNQSEIITLDVNMLNRGTYFIKVISKGNTFIETFIKQ